MKESNGVANACFSCMSSHPGNRGHKTLHQDESKTWIHMLIFWDVNSIWELEGGIPAQEKREVAEGENEF